MTAGGNAGGARGRQRTPNSVLRGIRENERGETRAEFARAMERVAWEMGFDVCPGDQYVQRLESGFIVWPHPEYRSVLERLCGRSARELGFAPSQRSGDLSHRANLAFRDAVWENGTELAPFAREVGVHPKTAERWITRGVVPRPVYRWKASRILGIDESELWPDVIAPDVPGKEAASAEKRESKPGDAHAKSGRSTERKERAEEDQEEMERRRLLQSLAALGVQVSPLNEALEAVRRAFSVSAGYDDRDYLDNWEETVIGYGYSYMTVSPRDLIPDLASDLVTVRSIIRSTPRNIFEHRAWCRVGGALSGLMAKSLSNMGQAKESRHWWEVAQHMSDTAGDLELGMWLRGQRIIHGLYENRPVQILMRQAEGATEYGHDFACPGLASVNVGKAQLLALSGDYQSAEEGLNYSSEILNRLSARVTEDASSVMGWGEAQLRYAEAWVYSHKGDEAKTDRAAEDSLRLYPQSVSRSAAQIRLMQAFARIRSGNISEGIRFAHDVYLPLASQQRTAMVNTLAQRVLNSVPTEARERADVTEYRDLIASKSSKIIGS